MRDLVLAVDVGTTSARAGVIDRAGMMLARTESPFAINWPRPNHAEHDSEEIWRAVCQAVQSARIEAGVSAQRIAAIAFDATCSLVVRGIEGGRVSVSADGDPRWDTIAWIDHRAVAEAEECTATGHPVLNSLGGIMHPEMQTPKLMWLKRNRHDSWRATRHFFDLADFLAWKACGTLARSQCTLAAKWTYLSHAGGWQHDFFEAVGIPDVLERGNLPKQASPVGAPLGRLSDRSARELGLDNGCVVGTGMIDAFAGALGLVGGYAEDEIERHLTLIAGTSSCAMAFTRQSRPAPNIWGPYYEATLPGYWMAEGGASAAGALLDHVIRLFGNGLAPDAATHKKIAARIFELREQPDADLGETIHILPDIHGNRSPLADPRACGVISGVSLDTTFDGLCRMYWRALVSIALAIRHVAEHFKEHGYRFETIHLAGGHARNPLFVELYADVTGYPVYEVGALDAVLLGTAAAAATAAGWFRGLPQACRVMQREGRLRQPNPAMFERYERDYRIFLKMYEQRREIEGLQRAQDEEVARRRLPA
jgi:FGGY-family pentulose kinase